MIFIRLQHEIFDQVFICHYREVKLPDSGANAEVWIIWLLKRLGILDLPAVYLF